jgi:hypothetical protein
METSCPTGESKREEGFVLIARNSEVAKKNDIRPITLR